MHCLSSQGMCCRVLFAECCKICNFDVGQLHPMMQNNSLPRKTLLSDMAKGGHSLACLFQGRGWLSV